MNFFPVKLRGSSIEKMSKDQFLEFFFFWYKPLRIIHTMLLCYIGTVKKKGKGWFITYTSSAWQKNVHTAAPYRSVRIKAKLRGEIDREQIETDAK